MNKNTINRRNFLQFLGRSGFTAIGLGAVPTAMLNSCNNAKKTAGGQPPVFNLKPIEPTDIDDLVLAQGFDYKVIARWGDAISNADTYGMHNDYVAFKPTKDDGSEGLLWINHEYMHQLLLGYDGSAPKNKEQVDKERYEVGGTIMRIHKNAAGAWKVVHNDPLNRRLTGTTPIPFAWHEPIKGSKQAIGTFANCAGGLTPWGTILSCEENYQDYYGETIYDENGKTSHKDGYYQWDKHYDIPPEHYGWVVEVDLFTGDARKLVALGRCAHECACVHQAPDGTMVVYTGDDAVNECLYKFVSSKPNSLEEGTLYVANMEKGEWVSLNIEEQPVLKEKFKSQTEVLIRLREAAKLVGGSPLDRPEDIEIDPKTGNILVALTNNVSKPNYFGSILKISEKSADKTGLSFEHDTFLMGGDENDFACPDNMAFDPRGNLWFTSDISGSKMNKPPYDAFKNNSLFYVPSQGEFAGKPVRIANAPIDAEFTGPMFTPDGNTLFLCVQHPGEQSPSLNELTSHWPDGGDGLPKSSIIAISGEGITGLCGI